jgi:hypothetical protein
VGFIAEYELTVSLRCFQDYIPNIQISQKLYLGGLCRSPGGMYVGCVSKTD